MDLALSPQLQEHEAVPIDGADDDLAVEWPFTLSVLPQLGVCMSIEGGEAVLPRHQDVGLPVVLNEQRSRMSGADGTVFLPGDFARPLVQSDQETRPRVVVPREQDRVIHDDRTQAISPGHFWITEYRQVAGDPHQFPVVGIAGDVRIAKSHVDCILGDGRCIDGEVGFLVGGLVDAKAEVVPPEFLAIRSVEAQGQK